MKTKTVLGTIQFKGASGKAYEFTVYPLDESFEDEKGVGAVYVVSKRTEQGTEPATHKKVYVGQTGDLSTRFDSHHDKGCFNKHGANCICIHREPSANERKRKEEDILADEVPPCNDQTK